jgi:C1A family cysteine protease
MALFAPAARRIEPVDTEVSQEKVAVLAPPGEALSRYQRDLLTAQAVMAFPASFDLRSEGKMTPSKNQHTSGCGAFAAMGSLESFLMPYEYRDFSEQDCWDYWAAVDGSSVDAYFTSWRGPWNEEDDPWILLRGTSSLASTANLGSENILGFSNAPSASRIRFPLSAVDWPKVRKHVQNVLFIPPRTSSLDNDLIKQALMTYGAISTGLYSGGTNSYSSGTFSFYNPGTAEGAHAVSIAGWNDNYDRNRFSVKPPGDGAFIAKNSGGPAWGDGGYYYISYYDAYFARMTNAYSYVFTAEPASGLTTIYQYDPYGWIARLGYGSDTGWFANVFAATSADPLVAVSFYTAAALNYYEVSVYKNPAPGQPRSGSLTAQKSGIINGIGYWTIPLGVNVPLALGQNFSVVVRLQTVGYVSPIPVEMVLQGFCKKATANRGESFVSPDGTSWNDLTLYQTGLYATANVCLKAFAGYDPLYPPAYFSVERIENDFVLFKEYIDRLTWNVHPQNLTPIVEYRIFKKASSDSESAYTLHASLPPGTLALDVRALKKDEICRYRIVAVDDKGRMSDPVDTKK